ncbi:hypothetical protein L195_g031167 [Trifolium pratense]|uniref:Uncharacterized protein n=1 Tax=Trifolium pratense TaxID=57577 RepID=A0A2K3L9P1_TRIPR|nr:hypothetical protein L195_g031167 [Trifolium pratense]
MTSAGVATAGKSENEKEKVNQANLCFCCANRNHPGEEKTEREERTVMAVTSIGVATADKSENEKEKVRVKSKRYDVADHVGCNVSTESNVLVSR